MIDYSHFYPRKELLTGQGYKIAIDQAKDGEHVGQDLNAPNRDAITNQGVLSYLSMDNQKRMVVETTGWPITKFKWDHKIQIHTPAVYKTPASFQTPLNSTTSHFLLPSTGTYNKAEHAPTTRP